jgi:hypothetical protein
MVHDILGFHRRDIMRGNVLDIPVVPGEGHDRIVARDSIHRKLDHGRVPLDRSSAVLIPRRACPEYSKGSTRRRAGGWRGRVLHQHRLTLGCG